MKTDKNSRTQSTSGTDTHPEQAFPDTNQGNAPVKQRERICYDRWRLKYRPIKNHIRKIADYHGCLFDSFYHDDKLFVAYQDAGKIWTLVCCGDKLRIREGLQWYGLGYFVTEVPAPQNRYFCISAE